MLKLAAAAGTTDIVATPHANPRFPFSPEAVEQRIAEVAAAAGSAPRIHYGCDFHLSFDNTHDALAHPSRYTVNHRCYLLVEFSDLLIPRNTDEILERFLAAGMIPIVTHPERNRHLRNRVDALDTWRRKGCLMQITGDSFLGRWGREAADFCDLLMRRDLVDFVASDGHDTEFRPPRLDEAFDLVARRYGDEDAARLMKLNPAAVIGGEPLPAAGTPGSGDEGRKWYRFWE